MRVVPNWMAAIAVYVIYNAIIFGTWAAVGSNYTDMVGEAVIAQRVVLPLALGAIFMIGAVTYLGWWKPALSEQQRQGPRWLLWLVVAAMLGFIGSHLAAAQWSAISPTHLLMLVAGGVLVGFNEELLNRGVTVTGLRGSGNSELKVWFFSSLLFGAMHIPNAFFGMPLVGGLAQAVLAFILGGAFYVIRRLSGTILLPMLLHGLWDFGTFSTGATNAEAPFTIWFMAGTDLVAIFAVIVLFATQPKPARA